ICQPAAPLGDLVAMSGCGGVMSERDAGELVLSLETARFEGDDERWLDQKRALYVELRREVGTVRRELTAEPGAKGATESLILALGSAGAFKAATTCIRAWLARDRTRRVELSWTSTEDGE